MSRPKLIWIPVVSSIANVAIPFVAFTLLMWDAVHEPIYQEVSRVTLAGMVARALAFRLVIFFVIAAFGLASATALLQGRHWAKWVLSLINLGLSSFFVFAMWQIWSPLMPFPRTEDVIVMALLVINVSSLCILLTSRRIAEYLEVRKIASETEPPPPPPEFTD